LRIRLWIAGWEWREVRAVKKGVSLIFSMRDLQVKTRRATPFGIRGSGVAVVKVEVRRGVGCGLGSELEKWKLIARGT